MELVEWESFLTSYGLLLTTFQQKNLPWDERIAQLTSELIEKEDMLAASAGGNGELGLPDVVPPEELQALSLELQQVLEMAKEAATPAPATREQAETAAVDRPVSNEDQDLTALADGGVTEDEATACAKEAPAIDEDLPLGRSVRELRDHLQNLLNDWRSSDLQLDDPTSPALERLRTHILLADFYATSMEQVLESKMNEPRPPVVDSLEPIRIAMDDYARLLCRNTKRQVGINLTGEELPLEGPLLSPVRRLLQCMVSDVFVRSADPNLSIEIDVEEHYGALLWTLKDNGSNFTTDAQLDPDEYLAFYPGLKGTCRIVSELRSLLWVEPDEAEDTRFSFTTPKSVEGGRFMVWGEGKGSFAVLSNQISDVLDLGDVELQCDSGDFLMQHGKRVPVVRLDQIYREGSGDGDKIAIIGFLEKRIAVVVSGEGRIVEGTWAKDAIPVWKELKQGAVRVQRDKLPLIEAEELLGLYWAMVSEIVERDVSGGVAEGKPDLSQTQANLENDYISDQAPSLIISEFRVPSMGAKILAEKLRTEGKNIPILVTTTHKGENAALLVARLGASGYISKPLNPAEVMSRIDHFLQRGSAPVSAS
jgi:CheY-like chemotaxis protein